MRLSQKPESKVPDKITNYVVKKYKQLLSKANVFIVRASTGKLYKIKPETNISMNLDFNMVIDGSRAQGNQKNILLWLEKNV